MDPKAHSHGARVTATAIDASNRLHWFLWECSHGTIATMTSFQNGLHRYY